MDAQKQSSKENQKNQENNAQENKEAKATGVKSWKTAIYEHNNIESSMAMTRDARAEKQLKSK